MTRHICPISLLSQATRIRAQHLQNAAVHLCMQVPGLPVYGVAIPTVGGLRLVLDQLQAMQGAHFCICSISTWDCFDSQQPWACPCASLLCLYWSCCSARHLRPCPGALLVQRFAVHFVPAMALTTQLANVVEFIFCCAGQRKVLWHNMREEPVLYINGNPHVVREANKPFANLEYTGQQSISGCGSAVVCGQRLAPV